VQIVIGTKLIVPIGIYRSKRMRSIRIILAILLAWWLSMVFVVVVNGGGRNPGDSLIFLVSSLIIIFLIGSILLFNNSDVVLFPEVVSFRLFAWTWRTIRFDEVGRITIFGLATPLSSARSSKVFSLHPKQAGDFYKFVFSDKLYGISELIEYLNVITAKYQIPIYVEINGNFVAVSRIVL
jgi:hypothetical protein